MSSVQIQYVKVASLSEFQVLRETLLLPSYFALELLEVLLPPSGWLNVDDLLIPGVAGGWYPFIFP
jgi:hypothetical protein